MPSAGGGRGRCPLHPWPSAGGVRGSAPEPRPCAGSARGSAPEPRPCAGSVRGSAPEPRNFFEKKLSKSFITPAGGTGEPKRLRRFGK
ncbi:hypothetical protein D7X33_04710 [Butyricicoccus sp. 1XD8-22]|nr:hypothetical protein D7X33_04710 [Butyricicoccus sp. 1XD8-22]